MGFYVKDLYVQRVPKFRWHDKLTNPPTVPETSPIIEIAALSPQIAQVRAAGGGGGAFLPADDMTLYTVPSWLTPIINPARHLSEVDLHTVRESLAVTLKAVDQQIEGLQGTAEDIEYATSVLKG
ncbi:hypothetical protein [Cellulomonas xylanilytica]|uniref:Uncharacterized protein n=1 Tax=Cellulomonas xylanilytica TaxID=233583 RepID=A0A510UZV0_9CELL|nr:hypothetical protein [Cellulomonas xylanilytica]GEK20188.1 hypothetical protein CXY01_07080 [Cellulomonas xylanilytica]